MAAKNRFEELSAVEIQELLDNAIPNSTKRATQFGMKIFNGKYLWNLLRNCEDKQWSSEVDNELILAQCYNYIFIYLFLEWLASPGGSKFTKPIEEMSKEELNACLKCFYTSVRKQDGSYYKTTSIKSIRAAIDRFLRCPPQCKPFSIIGDPAFTEANKVLDAFVKTLRKSGKIAGVIHKRAISQEQIQKLYDCGELGPADSPNPAQLQRTVWFYLGLFFGRRGRENQRDMKKNMLALRETTQGVEYFELNRRAPGSLPSTKNHQGGLSDAEDESDAKIFSVPESLRCPVKTIQNYLAHLNPASDVLFQRPRDGQSQKFKPEDSIWYCNMPLGASTLDNFMKEMSKRAGIDPHLTNHCLRATSVTVLSDNNCETRHIKMVTGHKSDQSIESYNDRPSLQQQQLMSSVLSDFLSNEAPRTLTTPGKENASTLVETVETAQMSRSAAPVLVQHNQFSTFSSYSGSEDNTPQAHGAQHPQPYSFHNCNIQIYNNFGGPSSH